MDVAVWVAAALKSPAEEAPKNKCFSRFHLVERLDLEFRMQIIFPRLFVFFFIAASLSASLLASGIEGESKINALLSDAFQLQDLPDVAQGRNGVIDFMRNFADTSADFYPVNREYVPDPEKIKITTGMRTYQAPRTLPSELRPRMRESFTLVAWVSSPLETWIMRTEPRGVLLASPLEVCWGWRYPAQLIFGFHDLKVDELAVDQLSGRLPPLDVSPSASVPITTTITQDALVVNATHAVFYRDAEYLGTVRLPRPVTDCDPANLVVGDSTGVRIGELTYFPRAFTSVQLKEIRTDGMSLLELVTGGAKEPLEVSDADFTTERVAVEASSSTTKLSAIQDGGRTDVTRSTVTLQSVATPSLSAPSANGLSANGSSVTAGASGDVSAAVTHTCHAGEPCTLTVAVNTSDPSLAPFATNTSSLRLVQGVSDCAAAAPQAFLIGVDSCVPASVGADGTLTFAMGTLASSIEPRIVTACLSAAGACGGATVPVGVLSVEHRTWAYLIDDAGITYTGTSSRVQNLVDPRRSTSSQFSVAFSYNMPLEGYANPLISLRRAEADLLAPVSEADVCWSLSLDSLRSEITLTTGGMYNSAFMGEHGAVNYICPLTYPISSWAHVSLVVDSTALTFYADGAYLCNLTMAAPLNDCGEGILRLGGSYQNTSYALAQEWNPNNLLMYGMKKYNISLDAAQARSVALCRDLPLTDDVKYMDGIGNPCAWYARFRTEKGYSLCGSEAARSCPIACGLLGRECPTRREAGRLFDRTMLFRPPTICATGPALARLNAEGVNYSVSGLSTPISSTPISSTRRRLGHLPQADTPSKAQEYLSTGACSTDEPSLASYDNRDFSFVVWTKGRQHMLQCAPLARHISLSSNHARLCSTWPHIPWAG